MHGDCVTITLHCVFKFYYVLVIYIYIFTFILKHGVIVDCVVGVVIIFVGMRIDISEVASLPCIAGLYKD